MKKQYDAYEAVHADDATIVWCRGTLHGEWPDGAAFAGIRFVDRFTVRHDRIVDQMVWNDLAESRRS